jgi:Tol biopolymer transport system component
MLFTLRRTVGWPLFALNVDGTGYRQLVSLPEHLAVGSPDCSPDGKKVAFDAWNRETDENYVAAHVFVVDLASDKLEDIAVGAMPSWSPDGRRLTFCQYSPNRGVFVMNADGSEKKPVDPDGWGSDWSPVGNEIAYTVYEDGANICIVNPDSFEPRLLFKKQEYQSVYWNSSWSPDGQYICFKGARPDGTQEIAIVSTKGDEQGFRVLVSTADGKFKSVWPIVAWDGNQGNILASLRGPDDKRPQLYLLDPTGEKPPTRLPGQDPDRINTDMAWSADGTTAIFISREPGLP